MWDYETGQDKAFGIALEIVKKYIHEQTDTNYALYKIKHDLEKEREKIWPKSHNL